MSHSTLGVKFDAFHDHPTVCRRRYLRFYPVFYLSFCVPHLGPLFVLAYFIYTGRAAPRAPFLFLSEWPREFGASKIQNWSQVVGVKELVAQQLAIGPRPFVTLDGF